MTKDEIKELALNSGFKLKEQPDGSMDLNPYVYEFARALLASRWTSADDRLPGSEQRCLAATKGGGIWLGYHNSPMKPDGWFLYGWEADECWHPFEITHWQPLPEPPTEVPDDV